MRGPSINNWSYLAKIALLVPGILMIINGLFPHSKLGKAGGIIYKFYVWV
jgi:hypothetical protein